MKCLESNEGDVRPKAPNVEETLASNTLASHEGMRTGAEPTVATCDHDDYEGRPNDVESNVEYNHMFQFSSLTDGKGPPICCLFCKKEGHLKDSCPDEKLPDLNQLPKFTRSHKEMLNRMLKEIPNVTVHLFGFGVTLTCVTFDSHKTREGHFFNQKYLTPDGPSPKDGCCTICNKIGHFPMDCPVRKQRYQRYY